MQANPSYSVTTQPTTEPLTLAQAKAFLRVSHSYEDDLITEIITTARKVAETECRRSLITQTITYKLPEWKNQINLPRPNLQSVTSITYLDTNGDSQTLNSSLYHVDTNSTPGVVRMLSSTSLPTVYTENPLPITVTYVAGYGNASSIPMPIISGIKLLVYDMWMNRTGSFESFAYGLKISNAMVHARFYFRMYEVPAFSLEHY